MKTPIKYVALWLGTAAIGGAIALAPIASAAPTPPTPVGSAGTDPLVPYGTDPYVPYRLGLHQPEPRRRQHHERRGGRAVLRQPGSEVSP